MLAYVLRCATFQLLRVLWYLPATLSLTLLASYPCLAGSFSAFRPQLKHRFLQGDLLASPHCLTAPLPPSPLAECRAPVPVRSLRALLLCCNCQQAPQPSPLHSRVHEAKTVTFCSCLRSCNCTELPLQSALWKVGRREGWTGAGSVGLFKKSGCTDTDPGRDPGVARNQH